MKNLIIFIVMLFSVGCGQAYDLPAGFDSPTVGGVLPEGFGKPWGEYTIVPNNRVHEMNLVPEGFTDGELTAIQDTFGDIAKLSSFEVIEGDEIDVVADTHEASDACKGLNDKNCWFGSAMCVAMSQPDDQNVMVCSRYSISISVNNLRAWSELVKITDYQPIKSVMIHETIHTMGIMHGKEGIMMSSIPIDMLKNSNSIYLRRCETWRLNAFETDESGVWNVINACQ